MRKTLKVLSALVVALVVVLGVAKFWADAHYYDGYQPALPLNAEVQAAALKEGFRSIPFYFEGLPDERVPGLLALPVEGDGPFPCLLFLPGIGQSKGFLEEIAAPFTEAGFAMVSFDQYTRGERRLTTENLLRKANGLRRRASLNVIETRRLIDYLETRPDISADRIYLLGASFGAITGVPVVAFEDRIHAAVLTYGGGDLAVLLNSEAAIQALGWFSTPAAYLGAFYMAPADPVQYVDRISPRPILFQNGKADSIIPPASAKRLQDAATGPKDVIWYEGDHVGTDEAVVRTVLQDALEWIQKQDAARVAAMESTKAPDAG